MLLFDMIRTAGWLAGTILHGLLLAVLIEGRRKRGTALAYLWLIGSALLWHLGNLLMAFLGELTGTPLPSAIMVATVLTTIGFGLLPSTLIHTAICARRGLFKRPRLSAVLGYLPAFALGPVIYMMTTMGREEFLKAFRESPLAIGLVGTWFVAAIALAARTIGAPTKSPGSEVEHLRFRRSFGIGLSTLAAALALAIAVNLAVSDTEGNVAQILRISVMLMSLLPGGLFFYHIYRYRYLDLTLRRQLSFAALVVTVFLAHALLIRRLTAALEASYGVDFSLLEGVLVVSVVLLFEPARRRVQTALDAALAPDTGRRQSELAALQAEVASLPPRDLRLVVARAQKGLQTSFSTSSLVALRIPWSIPSNEEEEASDEVICAPVKPKGDILPLLNWSTGENVVAGRPSPRSDLPPGAGLSAQSLGLHEIIAVRGEMAGGPERGGANTVGFIGLGPRPKGQALGEQDVSSLSALASTLAAVARDADALRRLVSLEHKLAEAEKLSSLGRLSATIAHEVKNPLSSIKTIVGVLRESGIQNPSAKSDLDVVAREVDRLSKVVTNLLNVARPAKKPGEGTSIVPSPAGFDAREMLEGILAVLGPDAQRRGVKIETSFAPGTPHVWARESTVRQAVFQLVLNAIEITPEGGTVTLSTSSVQDSAAIAAGKQPRNRIGIIVEDTGPGIPPDKVGRIFEPFVSMKRGGTGLGLALAREEISRADGKIEAGQRLDGQTGARFRVVLPAASRLAPT